MWTRTAHFNLARRRQPPPLSRMLQTARSSGTHPIHTAGSQRDHGNFPAGPQVDSCLLRTSGLRRFSSFQVAEDTRTTAANASSSLSYSSDAALRRSINDAYTVPVDPMLTDIRCSADPSRRRGRDCNQVQHRRPPHALQLQRSVSSTTGATFRYFSSTDDSNTDSKSAGNETTKLKNRTDPDFAEYLTNPDADHTAATPSAPGSTTLSPPDLPLHPGTRQSLTSEGELYKQTYKFIRRKQQTKVDNARQKTFANVRRALVGNVVICVAKLGAWISSGSSSMLSEFVHSVVDCGNQSLLLVGLHDSGNVADRKHPYGYGKSIYFWALVSALGTFFLGAGVSATHAVGELMEPSLSEITWHVWGVLGVSFAVDGWVFTKTVRDIGESIPEGTKTSFVSHLWTIRDPAMLAVLLEDGAACLGIVMAIAGIAATHATGMPVFDGLAGVGISGLLAAMGLVLVRVNHRFLLGQSIDSETTTGIQQILMNRRSIDNVHSVQSQWTGPDTFSYKAEVDFDGTFLAAKLMPRYQREFLEARDSLDQDLRVLLSWYAEDVMRTVEREVRHIEAEIRKEYPGAEFIELEPMSKEMDRFAIDDGMEAQLRRIEIDALNRYLKSLYPKDAGGKHGGENSKRDDNSPGTSDDLSKRKP